jgi:ActR/RegA family two-component response regulator
MGHAIALAMRREEEIDYVASGGGIGERLGPILLADDDSAFVRQFVNEFASRGPMPAVAASASEAISRYRSASFSDVFVEPGISGGIWYSFLRSMRDSPRFSSLHIVTSYGSCAMQRLAAEIGARSYIHKPTSVSALCSALLTRSRLWSVVPQSETLAALEWEHVNEAVYDARGNMTVAARRLGLPRQTLYRKLRKHAPPPEQHSSKAAAADEPGSLDVPDGLSDTTPPP